MIYQSSKLSEGSQRHWHDEIWHCPPQGCVWAGHKSKGPLWQKYAHDVSTRSTASSTPLKKVVQHVLPQCLGLDHPRAHERAHQHLQGRRQPGLIPSLLYSIRILKPFYNPPNYNPNHHIYLSWSFTMKRLFKISSAICQALLLFIAIITIKTILHSFPPRSPHKHNFDFRVTRSTNASKSFTVTAQSWSRQTGNRLNLREKKLRPAKNNSEKSSKTNSGQKSIPPMKRKATAISF